jgi:hypothetical protein
VTEILDTVQGMYVEPGDFIVFHTDEMENDEIEIKEVGDLDSGDVWIRYYSHITGESGTDALDPDTFYDIWGG